MQAILRRELPYWLVGSANRLDLLCGQQASLALCGDELRGLSHGLHVFARPMNVFFGVLTEVQAAL
jgi:hypothetical protein